MEAVGLEDALEVADGVVEPDVLAVPPVDRQQRLLEQRWKLRTGHATGVQEVLLGRSGPAQGLLDLGLVQVGLGLGQPSEDIGIGAQEPQHHILVGTDGEQLLEQLDDDQIVFADVVGGACWGEAESVMQPSHRRQLDALLGAELLVGAGQPRLGGHDWDVHE